MATLAQNAFTLTSNASRCGKELGKSVGFGIGLLLLPLIFFLILGFGSAQYQGPSALPGVAVTPPPQPAYAY